MTKIFRGWTLALPKRGELTRRQRISGTVSALAMTVFAWWLAQPIATPAAHTVIVRHYGPTVFRRVLCHYSTG